MSAESDEIARDSRGILDPGRMREHVCFVRLDPPDELRGIVQWFWAVAWSMPPGEEFVQPVLSHPSANLSVGPRSSRGLDDDRIEATAVGVMTSVDRRRLRGHSWNVAAKLEPGAFGAFLQMDAAEVTDRIVPIGEITDIDGPSLESTMTTAAPDVEAQAGLLANSLIAGLARVDPGRLAAARQAACLGSLIETDRSIRNVAELASVSGLGVRSLQRLFREHAGVSPLWMIRRFRLIDAADAARNGQLSWSQLAADLGYADQSHLSRDFKATVGISPGRYAATVTAL